MTCPASAAVKAIEKVCGFWHIMLFTMSFVLGDVMVTWTAGLTSGFGAYLVAKFTIGTAFICLTLCQAEMTSMLPFSGGSYGFARVTLGPFVGFIVGYMEALSNFMFTVEVAEHFGYLVQRIMGSTSQLRPVYWLFFYVPAVSLLLSGSKYFYPVTAGLSVFSLAVIAAYLLGTSPDTNFMKYVVNIDGSQIYPGGVESFIRLLPLCSQLWLGVQSVTLACENTEDASKVVPKAMLSGVVVVFLLSFVMTLSISSQYPGVVEVEHTQAPMSYGLAHMLNIPRAAASIFSLFAVFGVGLTHMFAYSRQIMALARSRLCLVCFKHTMGFSDAPVVAILCGAAVSYSLNLLVWGGFENEVHILLRTSRLFNFIGYLIVFASFLVFKISFSSMQRNFTNPIGYFSVAYGASIFLLAMLGILVFEEGQDISKGVCAGSLAAMFLYYYFVASKAQTYSKEEQHLLLKLYVIKGK
ncbi:amino acid/polyamine transporter I [Ochromonadaceae sp. CCMP2298]|nr:amino acid/polyamine transporter I [Ochromonadaceae sp. CCMP2298]